MVPTVPVIANPTIGTGTITRSTIIGENPTFDVTSDLAATTTTTAISTTALDSKHDFLPYYNTSKYLANQIVRAAPKIYIEELETLSPNFTNLSLLFY